MCVSLPGSGHGAAEVSSTSRGPVGRDGSGGKHSIIYHPLPEMAVVTTAKTPSVQHDQTASMYCIKEGGYLIKGLQSSEFFTNPASQFHKFENTNGCSLYN